MSNKSSDELIELLEKVGSLPVKMVKPSIDSLSMKFSDWCNLTGGIVVKYANWYFTPEQLSMFKNEGNISYSQYLEVFSKCSTVPFSEVLSNRIQYAKSIYPEYSLENMPDDEACKSAKIAELWQDVRAMYNPFQEIQQISQEVSTELMYSGNFDELPSEIEVVRRYLSQFKSAAAYLNELRAFDVESLDRYSAIVKAMEESCMLLEALNNNKELPLEDFMMKFGFDQEEVLDYYKRRLEVTEPDAVPFIKAREGKIFELKDGKIEIIDPDKAKELILDTFGSKTIFKSQIETIKGAREFKKLAGSKNRRISGERIKITPNIVFEASKQLRNDMESMEDKATSVEEQPKE